MYHPRLCPADAVSRCYFQAEKNDNATVNTYIVPLLHICTAIPVVPQYHFDSKLY